MSSSPNLQNVTHLVFLTCPDLFLAKSLLVHLQDIHCTRITEAEKDEFLSRNYNAPVYTDQFGSDDFSNEANSFRRRVREALGRKWRFGIAENDFFIDGDPMGDRMLGVEISNRGMISPEMIGIVHAAVSDTKSDYCVDVCDSWGFLLTEEGQRHPHFNIFVERNRILAYSESPVVLQSLGLIAP